MPDHTGLLDPADRLPAYDDGDTGIPPLPRRGALLTDPETGLAWRVALIGLKRITVFRKDGVAEYELTAPFSWFGDWERE